MTVLEERSMCAAAQARLEDLEFLAGWLGGWVGFREAAARVGTTEEGLALWCRRYDQLELMRRLRVNDGQI